MEMKLQVRDLRISFRTTNGKVQAVRDISFDLAKGETLAIVGESGSGKSVTSKAILGIQAGNSITEAGEIIYDGKDLLKITEEEFHKIRGDKIAMIFQDPMSSLNPIVKIGRQLTEAMLLKGKARQKESRETFNTYLTNLNRMMIAAVAGSDKAKAAELTAKCKKFDKFEFKHIELEDAFNKAHEAAVEAIDDIDVLAFELEKNAAKDAAYRVNSVARQARASIHEYVVHEDAERLTALASSLKSKLNKGKKAENYTEVVHALREVQEILKKAVALPEPNFFRMGYYMTFAGKALPDMPVEQLNDFLGEYLDREFMKDFIENAKEGLMHSANEAYRGMEEAVRALRENVAVFEKEKLDHAECRRVQKLLSEKVKAAIDDLAITKDSLSYTFAPSLNSEINRYFDAIGKNVKAEKVHRKNQAKYDHQVKHGKNPSWTVAAASVTDLDLVRSNICHLITRLADHYEAMLADRASRDFDRETVAVIDYLKENATGVVAKVTKRIAKARAIKLMEEVGIAEPRKRYNQYPFEFSGGMRQRIVIAIALAANPDILICDEPTTALDVTIQSQILELINKLKKERQLSVIFITHDLGVVANMADRVAVMYAGKIVEYGTAEDVFYRAAHPYTWALLSSMPDLDTNEKLEAIPGTPPNMIYPPVGDAFAARNKYAMQIDFERQPPMFQISDTHYAATWLLHPDAPKVDPPKTVLDRIARMKSKRGVEDAE
ncbi:MAG: ABC transporter ATP-binding protein [Clostridiaceae bacterium]|nr:ABC transporter ATP-binding protein [Clostridiaceae bacterium]